MRAGELQELVAADRVRARISELAEQMARDFDGAPFVIVRIDEGARRFVEALAQQLEELIRRDRGYAAARRRALGRLARARDLGWKRPTSRDELHER